MTNIYLVRHAETFANINKSSSQDLTDKGKIQIKRIAKELRNKKFDLIISSPIKRALLTANSIKEMHPNTTFIVDKLFREINQHCLGLEKNAESNLLTCTLDKMRYNKILKKILSFDEENILIVTHANVIKSVLLFCLNRPLYKGSAFIKHIQQTSITKITISDNKKTVDFINYTDHLENDLLESS